MDIPDVAAELADLHAKYVVVPADKASYTFVFVSKAHYTNCFLREELGSNKSEENPTFLCSSLSKEEILSEKPEDGFPGL